MHAPRKALYVVFLTIFVDVMGFGILIPIIPILLANPDSKFYILSPGTPLAYGYIMLGFLTAMFPLMQFFAAPILGQLSNRYGRKKILAISLFGTCLSYILFAIGILTKNIPLLFFSRSLDGATGGVIATAQASIADVTDPKERVKNFSLLGAAFGLAFILGPFLGGKLSDNTLVSWFDATTPFWFAAVLSFVNVLSVIFFLPETYSVNNGARNMDWARSFKNLFRAYNYRNLRILFLAIFLFNAGFTFFVSFISVFLVRYFSYNQSNIGDFFAWIGICNVLAQVLVVGRVSKKLNESKILSFSFLGTGITMMLFFMAASRWQLFLIAAVQVVFMSLTGNNATSLISRSAGKDMQGEILGINSSLQALAGFIPPAISGFIAAALSPSAPILFASIFILLSGFVFNVFYKSRQIPGNCQTDMSRCEGQWL